MAKEAPKWTKNSNGQYTTVHNGRTYTLESPGQFVNNKASQSTIDKSRLELRKQLDAGKKVVVSDPEIVNTWAGGTLKDYPNNLVNKDRVGATWKTSDGRSMADLENDYNKKQSAYDDYVTKNPNYNPLDAVARKRRKQAEQAKATLDKAQADIARAKKYSDYSVLSDAELTKIYYKQDEALAKYNQSAEELQNNIDRNTNALKMLTTNYATDKNSVDNFFKQKAELEQQIANDKATLENVKKAIANVTAQSDEDRALIEAVYGNGRLDKMYGTGNRDEVYKGLSMQYHYTEDPDEKAKLKLQLKMLENGRNTDRLLKFDVADAEATIDANQAENKKLEDERRNILQGQYDAEGNYLGEKPLSSQDQLRLSQIASTIARNEKINADLRQDKVLAKKLQAEKELEKPVTEDPKFEEHAMAGAALENNYDGYGPMNGERVFAEVANPAKAMREDNIGNDLSYKYMTDDEYALYCYWLDVEGKEKAEEYHMAKLDELNYRQGYERFQKADDKLLGKTALTAVGGFFGDTATEAKGLVNMIKGDDSIVANNAMQYAAGFAQEALANGAPEIGKENLGGLYGESVRVVSHMAPSMLLGSLTAGLGAAPAVAQGVGAAAMGTLAAGNYYNMALSMGYKTEEARRYAELAGTSEAALQYVLGGISSLGGLIPGGISEVAVKNIDNALLRSAVEMGFKRISEGAEEGLQDILNPVFFNLAAGEHNTVQILGNEEAAHSFLLAFITTGILEAPSTYKSNITLQQIGETYYPFVDQNSSILKNVARYDSKVGKLAREMMSGNAPINASNVGRIIQEGYLAKGDIGNVATAILDDIVRMKPDSEASRTLFEKLKNNSANYVVPEEVRWLILNNTDKDVQWAEQQAAYLTTLINGIDLPAEEMAKLWENLDVTNPSVQAIFSSRTGVYFNEGLEESTARALFENGIKNLQEQKAAQEAQKAAAEEDLRNSMDEATEKLKAKMVDNDATSATQESTEAAPTTEEDLPTTAKKFRDNPLGSLTPDVEQKTEETPKEHKPQTVVPPTEKKQGAAAKAKKKAEDTVKKVSDKAKAVGKKGAKTAKESTEAASASPDWYTAEMGDLNDAITYKNGGKLTRRQWIERGIERGRTAEEANASFNERFDKANPEANKAAKAQKALDDIVNADSLKSARGNDIIKSTSDIIQELEKLPVEELPEALASFSDEELTDILMSYDSQYNGFMDLKNDGERTSSNFSNDLYTAINDEIENRFFAANEKENNNDRSTEETVLGEERQGRPSRSGRGDLGETGQRGVNVGPDSGEEQTQRNPGREKSETKGGVRQRQVIDSYINEDGKRNELYYEDLEEVDMPEHASATDYMKKVFGVKNVHYLRGNGFIYDGETGSKAYGYCGPSSSGEGYDLYVIAGNPGGLSTVGIGVHEAGHSAILRRFGYDAGAQNNWAKNHIINLLKDNMATPDIALEVYEYIRDVYTAMGYDEDVTLYVEALLDIMGDIVPGVRTVELDDGSYTVDLNRILKSQITPKMVYDIFESEGLLNPSDLSIQERRGAGLPFRLADESHVDLKTTFGTMEKAAEENRKIGRTSYFRLANVEENIVPDNYITDTEKALDNPKNSNWFKGDGTQTAEALKKRLSGAIKPEEYKFLQMDKFFELNKNVAITKDDVMSWVALNNLQVSVNTLGESTGEYMGKGTDYTFDSLNAALGTAQQIARDRGLNPDDIEHYTPKHRERVYYIGDEELLHVVQNPDYDRWDAANAKYGAWAIQGGSNYREQLFIWNNGPKKSRVYQSGHFDFDNILGHVRLKDFSSQGKKVGLIEEMQSDWANGIRKFGYTGSPLIPQEISNATQAYYDLLYEATELDDMSEKKQNYWLNTHGYNSMLELNTHLSNMYSELRDKILDWKNLEITPAQNGEYAVIDKNTGEIAHRFEEFVTLASGREVSINDIASISKEEKDELLAYPHPQHKEDMGEAFFDSAEEAKAWAFTKEDAGGLGLGEPERSVMPFGIKKGTEGGDYYKFELKKLLKDFVENGYDYMAITSPEAQSVRYYGTLNKTNTYTAEYGMDYSPAFNTNENGVETKNKEHQPGYLQGQLEQLLRELGVKNINFSPITLDGATEITPDNKTIEARPVGALEITDEIRSVVPTARFGLFRKADTDAVKQKTGVDVNDVYPEGSFERRMIEAIQNNDADTIQRLISEAANPNPVNTQPSNAGPDYVPPVSGKQLAAAQAKKREQADKHGRMRPGEKAARDVVTPVKDDNGKFYTRVLQGIAEADTIPEHAARLAEAMQVTAESATYDRYTNAKAIGEADNIFRSKGVDGAIKQWNAVINSGKLPTKSDMALGQRVLQVAAQEGDYAMFNKVAADLAVMAPQLGQSVQAMSLLKRLTPAGQAYYIRRAVDQLNKQFSVEIAKGKMAEITIDAKLEQAILNAQTEQELRDAVDELTSKLAEQVPSTFKDKWNSWRYFSMLGNPKTHLRNVLGNAVFAPVVAAKNLMATGLENIFLDESKRTKAYVGRSTYEAIADSQFEEYKGVITGDAKYMEGSKNAILDKRVTWNNAKWMEKATTFVGDKLEEEDALFLKPYFKNALKGYLAAHNADVNTLETTKEGAKLLKDAREYAIKEAQKATYRDASVLATELNRMKRTPGVGWLVEGIMPFTKTPINILSRGLEYSPVGILKTFYNAVQRNKAGITNPAEFIDDLCSNMTGCMVAALGLFLAKAGIAKGAGGDDDKQNEFEELQGFQNFSINVPWFDGEDYNITIDWMAPGALPLFTGAAIWEVFAGGKDLDDGEAFKYFERALSLVAEPMMQLSMLDGLNSTLSSLSYANDTSMISTLAQQMAMSYFGQAVPTLAGQFARTFGDDTRRSTYVDKNSNVPGWIQRFIQSNIQNKVPVWEGKKMAYVDAWGRKDTESRWYVRALENFLSPGYVKQINVTAVDEELQALYDRTGENAVLPSKGNKYFSVNGETKNLTAEEYEKLLTQTGQEAYDLINQIINTREYKQADDDYKVQMVKDAYTYAAEKAKKEIASDYSNKQTDSFVKAATDFGATSYITNKDEIKEATSNEKKYALQATNTNMTPRQEALLITSAFDGSGSMNKVSVTKEQKTFQKKIFAEYYIPLYEECIQTEQYQSADLDTQEEMLQAIYEYVFEFSKRAMSDEYDLGYKPSKSPINKFNKYFG